MITKEKFVDIINFIKTKREQENKFCCILEDMSPCNSVDAFIYDDYESKLIDTLKEAIDCPDTSLIDYFIYDLEFGSKWKKGDVVIEYGKDIDISTPEKLYDFILTCIIK